MKTTIVIFFSAFLLLSGRNNDQRSGGNSGKVISINKLSMYKPDSSFNPMLEFNIPVTGNTLNNKDYSMSKGIIPDYLKNESENETDFDISIEKWMTNPDYWKDSSTHKSSEASKGFKLSFFEEKFIEADQSIEKWMTEPENWSEKIIN